MCIPSLGRVCVWCEERAKVPPPETVEEFDHLASDIVRSETCPWQPHRLPDRLVGYGYRGADQDGFDGEEWVTPQRDLEETLLEAIKVEFEAT